MQSIYSYSYCHHHLSYMGEEEVGNRLLTLGAQQTDKQGENSGLSDSLLTRSSRERQGKLCQGNIQLCVVLVIISALKRLPQTPCLPGSTWGQQLLMGCSCLQSVSDSIQLQELPLHTRPSLFPAALGTPARSVDSSAHQQSSASRFHRKPCKIRNIVQNYNENADAVLTGHRKTFIPQKLSMEPIKNQDKHTGICHLN